MSRYVDAEWLIKESMPLNFSVQKWVNEVQIMTAPSIDIVRCKECKHWMSHFHRCSRNACAKPWYANDYCNYGERKESE